MHDSTITLSKLEAASRQLKTAITMWFDEADPVPTHALAFAAYEIFHTVSLHRNPYRRDLLFDSDWIKDEFRGKWNKHIRKEANFFKHGDRDPEGSIEFNPEITEFFIFFASCARQLCEHPQSEEENLFCWWLQIFRPDRLTDDGRKFLSDHAPVEALNNIRKLTRSEFRQAWQQGRVKNRITIELT